VAKEIKLREGKDNKGNNKKDSQKEKDFFQSPLFYRGGKAASRPAFFGSQENKANNNY